MTTQAPADMVLLPCPFCGGAAELIDNRGTAVRCTNDQCIVWTYYPMPLNDYGHRASAIAAWNTRAPLAAAPALDREALAAAYIAGAMSVHEYWAENSGEAPRGDPEFDEAAGDWACAALSGSSEGKGPLQAEATTPASQSDFSDLRALPTMLHEQARDGTPVTDPREWEADRLAEALVRLDALEGKG